MSNEVKMVGYKATIKEYEEIKSQAKKRGISLSALLRLAVRGILNSTDLKLEDRSEKDRIALEKQLGRADSEVQHLREQLTEKDNQLSRKDEQIDHTHQVVAMSQKNIGALTEQLDDSRQMIEDMRQRRTVWQRIRGVFVAETA